MNRRWRRFEKFVHSGDWQLHTTFTDGQSSPTEYFSQAEKNGLEFLLFSEHVRKDLAYDYKSFINEVRSGALDSSISFAAGAEAKVLDLQGNLDISEAILGEAEVILFAFHTAYFKTKEDYIEAVIAAAKNPISDIWAHPTSYHTRMGFDLSIEEWRGILEVLKEQDICFEINKKYPLPETNICRLLVDLNVPTVFGSDAHRSGDLLSSSDLINFRGLLK